MVIRWNDDQTVRDEVPRRAAEYVRMSTDHQQYSTENQSTAIRLYAETRGFVIVSTYADEGKSGLNIGGRAALQRLISDIESGQADFEAIIVYDVSRFGRFQDPDEAASYELRCRRAGVAVHYCAEQFENDGTIGSSIIKTVKRAMAGEYSRELSVKVFAGQAHLIRLGYRQGGPPGFGLRRQLVDQEGQHKAELLRGEHKSIATDRVILTPGPSHEIATVLEVYRRFVAGEREPQIADDLNKRGIVTDLGRAWTRGTVHQLLINEKYCGHNVWARTSFKLKQQHITNTPAEWIRADNAFQAIIPLGLFAEAQAIIAARSDRLSDDAMLERLRKILSNTGRLSGLIIDEEDGPSSSAYRSRFGSLLRAYALVGFAPMHDYRYLEINRHLRALYPDQLTTIVEGLLKAGGTVVRDPATDILHINHEFRAAVTISRCLATAAGSLRWKVRLDDALDPDVTLVVRMGPENTTVLDYYLLPRFDIREACLRLAEYNGLSLDAYRIDTLEPFFQMATRSTRWKMAA